MKKRFIQLGSDISIFAKRELSTVQDVVDKSITTAVDVGIASKNSVVSAIDKSGDFLGNAVEIIQEKPIVQNAKNLADSVSEKAANYTEHFSKLAKDTLQSSQKIVHPKGSSEELVEVIETLKGKDKVGLLGETLAATGGGAAGVAVAGTIASATGASTILGSTSLASALGGTLVAATPVGWVVGSALVAGVAGYGIAKLVRSGSKQDQIRDQLVKKFEARLAVMNKDERVNSSLEELQKLLPILISNGQITEEHAERMIGLIERGALKADVLIKRLKQIE